MQYRVFHLVEDSILLTLQYCTSLTLVKAVNTVVEI